MRILLTLSITAAFALAQPSVEGIVLNAATGLPVSKAAVLISWSGAPDFRDTTDVDGRFVFPAIPPGEYVFSAERSGYVKTTIGLYGVAGHGTLIRTGDRLSGIVIKLHPEAILTGVVVTPDGKPLSCKLRLWRVAVRSGRRNIEEQHPPLPYTADADGSFVIGGLPPGRYYLAAELDFDFPIQQLKHQELATTYYPDGTEFGKAKPIDIHAGESRRDLRLVVQKTAMYTVSGTGSSPIPEFKEARPRFHLYGKEAWDPYPSLKLARDLNISGKYQIRNVPPGDYLVRGFVETNVRGQRRVFLAQKEIQVKNRNLTGVDLTFDHQRGAKLTGLARGLGNTEPMFVSLSHTRTGIRTATDIAPNGKFEMEIPPGNYTLFAGDGNRTERAATSIFFEGKDIIDRSFPITAKGGAFQIEFAKTKKVTGVVLSNSGKPLAGATVVVWRNDAALATANADSLGRFTLHIARVGAFRMAAWEDVDSQTAIFPSFLRAFASQSVELKIESGEPPSQGLRAIPRSAAELVIGKLP